MLSTRRKVYAKWMYFFSIIHFSIIFLHQLLNDSFYVGFDYTIRLSVKFCVGWCLPTDTLYSVTANSAE